MMQWHSNRHLPIAILLIRFEKLFLGKINRSE